MSRTGNSEDPWTRRILLFIQLAGCGLILLSVWVLIWPPDAVKPNHLLAFVACIVLGFALALAPSVSRLKVPNLLDLRMRELVGAQAILANRVDRLVERIDVRATARSDASATSVVQVRNILNHMMQNENSESKCQIPIRSFVCAVAIALRDTPLGERAELMESIPDGGLDIQEWTEVGAQRGFSVEDLQLLEYFTLVRADGDRDTAVRIHLTEIGRKYCDLVRLDAALDEASPDLREGLSTVVRAAGGLSAGS